MGVKIDFVGAHAFAAHVRSELHTMRQSCADTCATLDRCASAFDGDDGGVVHELQRLRARYASSAARTLDHVAEPAATLDRATDDGSVTVTVANPWNNAATPRDGRMDGDWKVLSWEDFTQAFTRVTYAPSS